MDISLWMGLAYMLFPELNRVCHCWILERKGSQCRIAEAVFQASKSEGVEEKARGSFHGGSPHALQGAGVPYGHFFDGS